MSDHIRLTIGESLRRAATSSQPQNKGKPPCPIRGRCEYVSTRCPDECVRYLREGGRVTVRQVDTDCLGRPIVKKS